MNRRLQVGDRVQADARGGWKVGEVVEVYGNWWFRLYGVRFVTPTGLVTMIYHRSNLRKTIGLTKSRRG